MSVCITLRVNPLIRYFTPTRYDCASKDLPSQIALRVQQRIDALVEAGFQFRSADEASSGGGPTVLLVTDRTMDVVSPILHEFTYQAMTYDLLDIQDDRYEHEFETAEGPELREVKISDSDVLWRQVRHMHMREAIDKLMTEFNKFCSSNTKLTGREQATTLGDMRSMLAGLSEFQEQRDSFSLHLGMAQRAMNVFETKQLPVMAMVEQDLANGLTADGRAPKTVLEEMVPILDDSRADHFDKVRLLLLYLIFRGGIYEADLKRLSQHSKLTTRDVEALKNLVLLGVRTIKPVLPDGKAGKHAGPPPRATYEPDEDVYELSRWNPIIKRTMEDQISGKMDASEWHYTRQLPETETNVVQHQSLRRCV